MKTESLLILDEMLKSIDGEAAAEGPGLEGVKRGFLILLLLFFGGSTRSEEVSLFQKADRLFAARDDPEKLRKAISLLEEGLASKPPDYEILWRLAKYKNYLAGHVSSKDDKSKLYESAIDLAKKAIENNDQRPEGHFWLAANYGEYAELKGPFKSLWLVRTIRQEFERVFEIEPGFDNGNLYLALGEMYLRLPWLMGGNHQRGLELLETGVKTGPTNADLLVTLAEYYLKDNRKSEARKLLETTLTLNDPLRSPRELGELRARSRKLLEKPRE